MDVFELTPDPKPKEWRRGTGVVAYSDSGELFINSELIGLDAITAFFCCSSNGTELISSGDRVLVPVSWVVMEKPHLKADIDLLVDMAKAATANK
jgi:hypothetical protein